MKITKLKIRNLFGIKEFDSDCKNQELVGKNGVGKSTVLDAIKLAFSNKSNRDFILRKGADEGEVLIETDTGISINRKMRTGKADYRSIKENGKAVSSPEAFLRELYTELQFNPVEFIAMSENEQNRIILDMIDFKWDLNWIKDQFGEIVPDVNYEQNILCVLNDIQSDDGFYFRTRQDINREARNKQAFVEEIGSELPTDYSADYWEKFNLGLKYKEIETILYENKQIELAKQVIENRDNKVRSFEAEKEISLNALGKEITREESITNAEIERAKAIIKENTNTLKGLAEKKIKESKIIDLEFEKNVAEFESEVKLYEKHAEKEIQDVSELKEEVESAEKMKSFINEYNRMIGYQTEIGELRAKSESFTEKIEHARTLPAKILAESKVPIDGLTIKNGDVLINELPISNLSSGELLNLCIDVAIQKPNALKMLLIDGTEKLSGENRKDLYKKLKQKDVRFIATRTDNHQELTVIEL